MMGIENKIEMGHRKFKDSVKDSIDISQFRKIEILENGDKFVHDLNAGYMIDGATEKIKEWLVKHGAIGGNACWLQADFRWNGIIGPGSDYGLYPLPPIVYR